MTLTPKRRCCEEETERHWKVLALKIGATWPQVNERQLPPELEQVGDWNRFVPYSLWRERDPADTLIPNIWSPDWERISFCWSKLPNVEECVTAAIGNSPTSLSFFNKTILRPNGWGREMLLGG